MIGMVPLAQASTKEAEQAFFDAYYKERAANDYPSELVEFLEKFRRVELIPFCDGGWNWWADPHQEVFDTVGPVGGLSVLDYACGSGKVGVYLSSLGAHVQGFDLSTEAIQVAKAAVGRYHLSAEFQQMDAESLTYPDSCFDLVIGFGVLHHVIKYSRASAELLRVMKPCATAVFVETLWDNPLLNFGRRLTLAKEDAGDAHLTERVIHDFCRHFGQIKLDKRHLIYMLKRLVKLPNPDLSLPVRPRPFWKFVKAVDDTLLRLKPLRGYCGEVIVWLKKGSDNGQNDATLKSSETLFTGAARS
jgi:2-polyprenyl-3-methyl-5-hydroxy-6-metoxy-1,4-benzoquinol methylase